MKRANTKKAKRPKKPQDKSKSKKKGSAMAANALVASYAKLVMDPCEGPIERLAGNSTRGGIVERQRSTLNFPALAAENAGYLVWFPSFHGPGGIGQSGNLFYWSTTNTALRPVNTIVNPLGTTLATSGQFIPDPTSPSLAAGSVFTRARCVSACMQLDFIGSLANAAGQVAVIRNLSMSAFNSQTGSGNAFVPLTVDEMFAYAHTRERINLNGHEAVWRPTDSESVLRTNGIDFTSATFEPDTLFTQGNPATSNTVVSNISPMNTMGIAIAWRGTTATANFLTANFIKVVELELAPRSNLIEAVPRPAPGGRVTFAEVTDYLDRYVPDWQSRAIRTASTAFSSAMRTYAPRLSDRFRAMPAILDS